ncbi:phage tail sheath protein [Caballeronia calidae]|uniref:Phage tail sheath protein n=1 Tax=Caballeronia calidae TaxID=1777139 RepID=A0A158EDE5_9BURK|nr:phage tail sheath C-terminal domain-containing protein [Caballeronia calidae]SAL04834.1 phage tail sheath protein [Caballeronia calidae]
MLQGGYPGVYIQEIPSGVHTVTAAATSNLAVIGHFPRGPVGEALRVNSWADVERTYGGLDRRYLATYALQDFFLQGGSVAYVVRAGFQQATATLTTTETAMQVVARNPGAAGNRVHYAVAHNPDNSFDLSIFAAEGEEPVVFAGLSVTYGTANYADTRVNGSQGLVKLANIKHMPAETDAPVALTHGAGAAGSDVAVAASAALNSVPLPALILQAIESGADRRVPRHVEAVNNGNGTFNINIGDFAAENLTINPAGGGHYVVTALAAAGSPVRVVTTRGPLRVPATTATAVGFSGGGEEVPAAEVTLTAAGGGSALQLEAANAGEWGNSLRVGVANNPTGGFDLIVAEFRGSQPKSPPETFRGLNTTPADPNNALEVINHGSQLLTVIAADALPSESAAGVAVDDLTIAQMKPLSGGLDGVLPDEPTWAANALGAFTAAIPVLDGIEPEIFNLMIVPEAPMMADEGVGLYALAADYCARQLAFLLVDHPDRADSAIGILDWNIAAMLGSDLGRNAALCFPRVRRPDPLNGERERAFPASGAIAGVMARTDARRGVWKAPAGTEASIIKGTPSVMLTDLQQGRLNQRGLNSLRAFPNIGTVHWGARTLAGSDALASEWKYVPVRRTALFIERSLKTALAWAVFEPNDEPLWANIRLNVNAFMQDLFSAGAFAGVTAKEAYHVKCDKETTSQQDVNSGIVNIEVGFQPLKPAEFVVLKLTQLAGRFAA